MCKKSSTPTIDENSWCPRCNSLTVTSEWGAPTSKDGYIERTPVDICHSCGFYSKESFSKINFRNKRDLKINQLLENGIQ